MYDATLLSMTFGALISYTAFELLVPALFTVSAVSFMWGVFLYVIAGAQDEEMQERGKTVMLYALLSFVVMVLVWGLFQLVARTLAP